MQQVDTLAFLAIGVTIFVGALQMKPRYRLIPVLLAGAWIVISWSVIKLALPSDWATWVVATICMAGLGAVAWVFGLEAWRSANIEKYIHIWERNFENWDEGTPDSRKRLTEVKTGHDTYATQTLSLPVQKCPARFTPTFQTLYDTIESGARAWITIAGASDKLKFDNDQLGEWRAVLGRTTQVGQFVGNIDLPIYPGKGKIGPDGIIKVHFPVGLYKISYKIEGESRKGVSFGREGFFIVNIYDADKK